MRPASSLIERNRSGKNSFRLLRFDLQQMGKPQHSLCSAQIRIEIHCQVGRLQRIIGFPDRHLQLRQACPGQYILRVKLKTASPGTGQCRFDLETCLLGVGKRQSYRG